jgi:Protein of unknown function (DUF4038)/Domain of unknown function (DUF5060)
MKNNLYALKTSGSLAVLLLTLGLASAAIGADHNLKTAANVMAELTLAATGTYGDPFNQVTLDVVFTDPRGSELRVPAFWDGGNVWKARYASPLAGKHTFRTECSETGDKGLHGIKGAVEITPYTGQNPLFQHGPLKVASDQRHFDYNDGTPFFWLGDTWWMGLSHRLHWPEDVQTLAADRKQKGFNVIQIVAGLYPDMPPFDPRGANEAGFPWETNYARIRPQYFDAADQRLMYLVEQGFTPCIVGAWGYFLPSMGVEKMKAHWRYLIARYGALPVVWCAAGEANLPWYLAKGFPYDDRQQVHDWTEVMRFIRATDPYHRLLTVHPTGIDRLSARHATDDPALLDFDMLQTPHGQREAVPITINTVRESYADKPVMPVIDGEASYEMLNDSLPTEWTRRMFWISLMNGAAGHTYGANGIWQVNRPGDPHGASPHGGNYGKIPWNEAMNLPGSRQVALGKRLLEQYPWQDFLPHPEWAKFAVDAMPGFSDSRWIWYPEGQPAKDAPAESRFFRRQFILPKNRAVQRAALRLSADDKFTAFVNGRTVGSHQDWHTGRYFPDVAALLRAGKNVLAVEAANVKSGVAQNPAGLIGTLVVEFKDGSRQLVGSDPSWICAREAPARWNEVNLNDTAWVQSMSLGPYGMDPWGKIGSSDDAIYGPQAAGIPDVVRIIYVPKVEPIAVLDLGRETAFAASCFDPVIGARTSLEDAHADDEGIWRCPPLPGQDHDWVLILEFKNGARTSLAK